MTGHRTSVNLRTAWRSTRPRWDASCDDCPWGMPAESEDGARFLADEHHRQTNCECWSVEHVELAPGDPCGPWCVKHQGGAA